VATNPGTWRQDAQQRNRTTRGRYDDGPKCNRCGKSAGHDYYSDRRTDTTDSAGNQWADIALVLCHRCCYHLEALPDAEAYAEMVKAKEKAEKKAAKG
jgi:hypothetical protein